MNKHIYRPVGGTELDLDQEAGKGLNPDTDTNWRNYGARRLLTGKTSFTSHRSQQTTLKYSMYGEDCRNEAGLNGTRVDLKSVPEGRPNLSAYFWS